MRRKGCLKKTFKNLLVKVKAVYHMCKFETNNAIFIKIL
jgi:hypothetical protein